MSRTGAHGQSVCLSVAMIVRDKADVIAASVKSVRAIADEIVILDTGSVDQTIEIAERLGARVIEAPWSDDFSAARNLLLSHCRGKWVFWLDAGELEMIRGAYNSEKDKEKEEDRYVDKYIDKNFGDEMRKMREQSAKKLGFAKKFARIFRFVCPSYYIQGKQNGAPF